MQHRMKEHPLTKEQITELLQAQAVGHFSTIGQDGYPYTCPVHFVYLDEKLYFHGLPKGEKLSNIEKNSKICFETCVMEGLILDEKPCDVNTQYESVIVRGEAKVLEDLALKEKALLAVVEKYTPQLLEVGLPPQMVKGTAVVEITIANCTGKFYK